MRIFVPLILLGVSVTSYGCHVNNGALQLKRETYADKISATSIFTSAVGASKGYQMKDGVFQLFDKGTVTANIDIKLALNRFYFSLVSSTMEKEIKIDCQDVNESISNKTTINWSLSDNYAKFSDEKQGTIYVKYDQGRWWECFESNKTRKDITELVASYQDIRNLIFDSITRSLSVKLPKPTNDDEFDAVCGMDISGFIGMNKLLTSTTNANGLMAINFLSPMSILSYAFDKNINVSLLIDAISFGAPLVLGKELTYFNGSMDLSQNACCGEIGVKTIDLAEIQKIFNDSIVQLLLYYLSLQGMTLTLNNGQGTADFDFFLNYKNNFIHQEEVLLNLKDINFNLYAKRESTDSYIPSENEYINGREDKEFEIESEAKKINLDFLMNQEVTNTCEVDIINVSDYTVQQ